MNIQKIANRRRPRIFAGWNRCTPARLPSIGRDLARQALLPAAWLTMLASIAGGNELAQWTEDHLDALTEYYQELHQTPELSFQEEDTAAKMAAELTRLGFETTEGVGGHGVVGYLANGDGPTLMLRADMDALPVVEQTGVPYASQVRVRDDRGATVGVMHACGHDVHMANLIGVLRFLASHREQWSGSVLAIFQPAEERGAGAKAMLEDGLLRRFPRPDFALALHVAADKPTGVVSYRTGYAMANVDSVDITIHGRGGHGAYPHTTIDPIVIAARLVLDLQTIVAREVKPIEPAVVTVGSFQGGAKHNVISDQCKLQLTVRSYAPAVRRQLLEAIERKANAAAQSAGAPPPTVEISEGTPSLWNDPELAAQVLPAIRQAIGEANVVEAEPSMGGEDFGRYGRAGVPILMMGLGSVAPERLQAMRADNQTPPSLHSPNYYPDPAETIETGVRTMAAAALALLSSDGQDAAE